MPSLLGKRPNKSAVLKLEGDFEGMSVTVTYRPDALGFDEDDYAEALKRKSGAAEGEDDDGGDDDGLRFFRSMVALLVDWNVEGPFVKVVFIDGRPQEVEVLPTGPVEITVENLRLVGIPALSAIQTALLKHSLGNPGGKRKR